MNYFVFHTYVIWVGINAQYIRCYLVHKLIVGMRGLLLSLPETKQPIATYTFNIHQIRFHSLGFRAFPFLNLKCWFTRREKTTKFKSWLVWHSIVLKYRIDDELTKKNKLHLLHIINRDRQKYIFKIRWYFFPIRMLLFTLCLSFDARVLRIVLFLWRWCWRVLFYFAFSACTSHFRFF